jgi:hypothetical protein
MLKIFWILKVWTVDQNVNKKMESEIAIVVTWPLNLSQMLYGDVIHKNVSFRKKKFKFLESEISYLNTAVS